ncbi:MAG: hypothetical protein ACE37B_18750 [Ilumatobacter sp.]|uniref:hypothetical protein n=1 Tax=Ilumatobacter sp. TaxID=1967498 RepID=UPI00391A093D
MFKFLALATVSLAAVACGSSTTTNDGAIPGVDDGGAATTDDPSATTLDSALDTTVPDTTVAETVAPDTTPAPDATEPPVPETTAAPAPETTAAPAPPPTVEPTTQIAAVYGGGGDGIPWAPLAWWDGSAWNQAGYTDDGSFVSPPPSAIANVAVTSLDLPDGPGQVITGLALGPNDFYCVGDELGPQIDLGVELPDTPVSLGYDAIAVTADWPLQPRPVSQVGTDSPIYQEVGAALMSAAPTSDLGTVAQVVRADLDANGIEEVLVTYEYITESGFGAENDFTSIYLRVPAADGSVTDSLVLEYVLGDPTDFPTVGRFTIAAIADLNGDGAMEVALRDTFWESAGISIWEFRDGTLVQIGGGGCGV